MFPFLETGSRWELAVRADVRDLRVLDKFQFDLDDESSKYFGRRYEVHERTWQREGRLLEISGSIKGEIRSVASGLDLVIDSGDDRDNAALLLKGLTWGNRLRYAP